MINASVPSPIYLVYLTYFFIRTRLLYNMYKLSLGFLSRPKYFVLQDTLINDNSAIKKIIIIH